MTSPVLYSSKSDLYPTPQDFFDRCNRRFGPLTTDVCALPDNAKCPTYFTPEVDGLRQQWTGKCWMNPPFGKAIGLWLAKAVDAAKAGATVVCLLPARVDTKWWHTWVEPYAQRIEFPKGRLCFGDGKYNAPFPCALVVFRPMRVFRCQWCERAFKPRRGDAKFCGVACKQAAYRARLVTALSVTEAADEAAASVTTEAERNNGIRTLDIATLVGETIDPRAGKHGTPDETHVSRYGGRGCTPPPGVRFPSCFPPRVCHPGRACPKHRRIVTLLGDNNDHADYR